MIRRAKEMEKFVHEGLTGEKPHEVTKWLLPEDIPGHGRAFYKVVIPPKSAYFEYYKTNGEFEAIFVLEGHLDAHISGESAILGPGDFAVTETDTYIEATNETDNDVVVMTSFFDYITPREDVDMKRRKIAAHDALEYDMEDTIWREIKNPDHEYHILYLAFDTDDLQTNVVYKEMFGEGEILVSSLVEFEDRFEDTGKEASDD